MLGLEPRIHASGVRGCRLDPRVEPEDDGVWGKLCSRCREHDKIGANSAGLFRRCLAANPDHSLDQPILLMRPSLAVVHDAHDIAPVGDTDQEIVPVSPCSDQISFTHVLHISDAITTPFEEANRIVWPEVVPT